MKLGDRVIGMETGMAATLIGIDIARTQYVLEYDDGQKVTIGWEGIRDAFKPLERPKAETAEPRGFKVGDRVVCNGETGEVAAVDKEGLSVQYDYDKAEGAGPVWCSYGLWGRERLTLLEAAPEAPGEPAKRAFEVGGRVRNKHRGQSGTVMQADSAGLLVRYDGEAVDTRTDGSIVALIEPPIAIEDSKAVLPPGPLCEECQGPARAGHQNCSDCCSCYVDELRDDGVCPTCGDYWADYDERNDDEPEETRPYDEGGTNPCGFPALRRPDAAAIRQQVDSALMKLLQGRTTTPSVVLPFDAFIAGRETVRRGAEVAQAQPQIGDAVRAWMWQVFPPKRIEGVMADADDCDPDIIIVRNRQGGRRTQWLSMCHREGAEVIKRRGEL